MITIEALQAELGKAKHALTFNLARKQELEREAAAADVLVNKIRGRIDLLNEQLQFIQKSAEPPNPAE